MSNRSYSAEAAVKQLGLQRFQFPVGMSNRSYYDIMGRKVNKIDKTLSIPRGNVE